MTECRHRLTRETVESPCLDIIKSHLDHPGYPVVYCPSEAGRLDEMASRGPFQPKLFSNSVTVSLLHTTWLFSPRKGKTEEKQARIFPLAFYAKSNLESSFNNDNGCSVSRRHRVNFNGSCKLHECEVVQCCLECKRGKKQAKTFKLSQTVQESYVNKVNISLSFIHTASQLW